MGHQGEESGPAPCATALHGPGRYVEDARGFGDGIGLHIHEDEGGALFGGQCGQCCQKLAVQVLPNGGRLGGFMGLHELIEPLGVIDRRGLT